MAYDRWRETLIVVTTVKQWAFDCMVEGRTFAVPRYEITEMATIPDMIDFALLPPYTRIVVSLAGGDTVSVLAFYAQDAIDAQSLSVEAVTVEGGAA